MISHIIILSDFYHRSDPIQLVTVAQFRFRHDLIYTMFHVVVLSGFFHTLPSLIGHGGLVSFST